MKGENQTVVLYAAIRQIIQQARLQVVRNVNTVMVYTYFEIGRRIVEHEQSGQQRASYARQMMEQLSKKLTAEFGKGYSKANLEYFRRFYSLYKARIPQSVIGELDVPFTLSWTHYIQLLKIENEAERTYYEIEAAQNNWSVRELQRQYSSSLYERVALSKDKEGVKQLSQQGQVMDSPLDALKSPFVLEFLELKEDSRYSESDLETAIINKLEQFMLELGKGFLFEGRQRRIMLEGDHFHVDLVFYNRLLHCFVLIDLKIGKLTHGDIGQMQMYVNYYDRKMKLVEERPTIGIILCKEENKTVVEFTLPEDNRQIFAKEYKLYLPSKEELRKQLE